MLKVTRYQNYKRLVAMFPLPPYLVNGLNMLSNKPANDTEEFYKAIERIQDEMARAPHTS